MALHLGNLSSAIGDIAAIAGSSMSRPSRAQEILARIRKDIPFVAACTTLIRPDGRLRSKFSSGYSQRMAEHLETEAFKSDLQTLGLFSSARSIRLSDVGGDSVRLLVTYDHLSPAGFKEGVTTPLYNSSDRLVGFQNISFGDFGRLDDHSRDFLDCIAPTLANLLDPLSTGNIVPRAEERYQSLVVVDASLTCTTLFGSHPEWAADRTPAACAFRYADEDYANWLIWCNDRFHAVQLWRATSSFLGGDGEVVIVGDLGPVTPPLTRREAEVARLVAEGRRNADIATVLNVAPRTANAHVEAILHKLEAENRAAATATIIRQGWRLLC